ncbi:MAG TPA: DUF523 domain-containing protein [Planctomycetota bacterium]|nr:DUF523 domain-containing protein [Planctomycetota bacterium]
MPEPPVLISACLLGINTRYDGGNRQNDELLEQLKGRTLIPVCPEQLGGMPTPRPPSSLQGCSGEQVLSGRAPVINAAGRDVTQEFIRGAHETLLIATKLGVKEAYFKSRSPSCGLDPLGVAAALLRRYGIEVHEVE